MLFAYGGKEQYDHSIKLVICIYTIWMTEENKKKNKNKTGKKKKSEMINTNKKGTTWLLFPQLRLQPLGLMQHKNHIPT